jgi:hypothetical protein
MFARLRRWQTQMEIRIVDRAEACKNPHPFNTLQKLSGQKMIWREEEAHIVPLVIDAMTLSLLLIESFVVQFDNYATDWTALIEEPVAFSNTLSVFSGLKDCNYE